MFDDIGGKIKFLAKFVCWVGIIISIVLGIVMLAEESSGYGQKQSPVLAIAVMVVGALLSWVSSFTLYGFGQLVENSDILAERAETVSVSQAPKQNNKKAKKDRDEVMIDPSKTYGANAEAFLQEIRETSTEDLELILQDQKDLYSKRELELIKEELKTR